MSATLANATINHPSGLEYQLLDRARNEIRLLTLSGVPSDNDLVKCKLEKFSLNDTKSPPEDDEVQRQTHENFNCPQRTQVRYNWGDYLALSYVCGSSDETNLRSIIVNDHTFKVTKNLEAALRQLSGAPEVQKGLKVWADAICVNQDDVEERNREVKRMRHIYIHALDILVWLGPGSNRIQGIAAAIRSLSELSSLLEHPTQLASPWRRNENPLKESARLLYELFASPYWHRLWIMQEIAVAYGATQVLWGQERMNWRDIVHTAHLLMNTYSTLEGEIWSEFEPAEKTEMRNGLHRVCQLRDVPTRMSENETDLERLGHLLQLMKDASVTDPKDQVYGILGLLDSELTTKITVDYSMPLRDVYLNFTKATIRYLDRLNIIILGDRSELPSNNWPSWVPDWRKTAAPDCVPFLSPYLAGGDNPVEVRFEDDSLLCLGFKLPIDAGRVVVETPTPVSTSGEKRTKGLSRSATREVEQYVYRFMRKMRTPEAQESHTPALESPLETFLAGRFSNTRLTHENAQNTVEQSQVAFEELSWAMEVMSRRKMVAFSRGSLIWSTYRLDENDVVCILLGCDYPVILRPCGQRYELVGPCYIYEIMMGEALMWLGEDDYPLETFTIA